MREILFRGKVLGDYNDYPNGVIKDKGWLYGDLHQIGHHIYIDGNKWRLRVEPETVGQFTGLLDKNGNKIFEGDIIKSKYNSITEIKFGEFVDTKSHEQVGFYQVYLDDDDWAGVSHGTMDYVKDSEIIGNIHDNGDLYKESKGEIK